MPTGTVRYVDRDRGFGFISRDDKQPKVFVHVTAVLEAGYADLEKGQRWAFDLAEDRGKQVAVNLTAI
ncbi:MULTISPECIES: cold-shock protein [Sphingobium]|jgi:CspA family cold shock protein|uniref:Cold-shock protein n=1 Tax=Sphingobium yanoikuyae TaxID=13690 RepID=A0A6M4GI88_SPHYA|nr:cold shock domain-containing protein [Sphingobium yanoikuyae]QJR06063.1 cold-shock protein [Sphingobium yanoikuyae]